MFSQIFYPKTGDHFWEICLGAAHGNFEIAPPPSRCRLLAGLRRCAFDAAAHRHLPDGAVHGRAVFRGAGGKRKRHAAGQAAKADRATGYSAFAGTVAEEFRARRRLFAPRDACGYRSREEALGGAFRAPAATAPRARVSAITKQLDEQRGITAQALAQIELLNQQIVALRKQLAALENSLGDSDKRDKASQAQIADLGQRLNVALAKRVQELAQYRSNFFGELKKTLGDRDDIQVVGDRFVFQSEIFFESGSADLNPEGYSQLDKLAAALQELEGRIPKELNWVLRVDGHTDIRPISTATFRSNWSFRPPVPSRLRNT